MTAAEAEQRARVVAIGHEWIGTPYRHGGRIKRVAADCTFLALVYEEAGVLPHLPIAPYSPQAHLHRAGGRYVATIENHGHVTDNPKPGDIAMYFFGRDFSHGALVIEPGWPHVLHADIQARFVITARGDAGRLAEAKRRRFYTLW